MIVTGDEHSRSSARVSSLSLWQKPLRKLVWQEGFTVAPASRRFQFVIGWLAMWGPVVRQKIILGSL